MSNTHMSISIQNSYHMFDQIYPSLQGFVFLEILTFRILLSSLRQDQSFEVSQISFDLFESFKFTPRRPD